MKRIILIALCVLTVLLLCACCALAETGTKSGDYTYTLRRDGTACITRWEGTARQLTLPRTLDGHAVTEIGRRAFSDCSGLTSVTIPGTIKTIGGSAFSFCSGITTLIIEEGVETIDTDAFFSCSSLTSVTLPDSAVNFTGNPLEGCDMLRTINISSRHPALQIIDGALYTKNPQTLLALPNADPRTHLEVAAGTVAIAESALSWCNNLQMVTLPASVRTIGNWAFAFSGSLRFITLSNTVETIGSHAFESCSSLSSLSLPASVREIGDSALDTGSSFTAVVAAGSYAESYCREKGIAFRTENGAVAVRSPFTYDVRSDGSITITGWTGHETIMEIPDTIDGHAVVEIGADAFADNTDLVQVVIPRGVTRIGSEAFMGCQNVTSFVLPDTLTSIGDWAFERCDGLTSLALPDSLQTLGINPFIYCRRLTDFTLSANHPYLQVIDGALFSRSEQKLICYPYALRGRDFVVPAGTREIARWAFYNCDGVASITIPEGVTRIGNLAFTGCDQLTSLKVPEGVTTLGFGVFEGCERLTAITLPASLAEIGTTIFQDCPQELVVTVAPGSYAESYCLEEGVTCAYPSRQGLFGR